VEFPIFIDSEKVETRKAIWLQAKSDLTPEQYEDFYKYQTHAYDKPLDWLHFKSDVPLELNALIYIPSENAERLGFGKLKNEVASTARMCYRPVAEKSVSRLMRSQRNYRQYRIR
jgi:molecular chaperone HtpG